MSGTFVSKYLVDYDEGCALDITIFDPQPIGQVSTSADDHSWQGSRVASVKMDDGSTIEIGASVFYSGFELIVDMIKGDPSLTVGEAFNTGQSDKLDPRLRKGLGIYNGDGDWKLLTTKGPSFLNTFRLLWRYNVDLFRAVSATKRVKRSFRVLHDLLDSSHISTFFEWPDQMWDAVGLLPPARASFDDFMDLLGISRQLPRWRRLLPYQGLLRDELMAAINLCNYNQGNAMVNGK